jgi:hypothetical protein
VREVGQAGNAGPPHSRDLLQKLQRAVQYLDRVGEDHVVDGPVLVVGQALVEVALVHVRHALRHARLDAVVGDLDPLRPHVLQVHERPQQIALAAAEVEDAAAIRDEVDDHMVLWRQPRRPAPLSRSEVI